MRNIAADNVADLESIETSEWLDSLDYVLQIQRPRASGAVAAAAERARAPSRHPAAVHREHAIRQHADDRPGSAVPRQPGDRAPHQEPRPLERHRDGRCAPTRRSPASADTSRRSPRRRRSTKSASTISSGPAARRRSRRRVLPGSRGARHLLARVSRRAPHAKSSSTTSGASSRPAAGCRRIRIRG